ncbi:MAG: CHAT domain-containing protein [Aureispira sp.]
MRIVYSYLIYSSLLVFLWGWCSSFQQPTTITNLQASWEHAKQKEGLDSLVVYQAMLQDALHHTGNTALSQDYTRRFLAHVLSDKVSDKTTKRRLLEQYASTPTWDYAYRVHWHGAYGERDSAYFYQSLLERLTKEPQPLIYAYGQLAVYLGVQLQNYQAADDYLHQAEDISQTVQDSQILYPFQLQVYTALGQYNKAKQAGLSLLQNYKEAITIDSIALAHVLEALGGICQEQAHYQEAIQYTKAAIDYLSSHPKYGIKTGACWYQLAKAYYSMGNRPLETILYVRNALQKWEGQKQVTNEAYMDVYKLLAQQFLAVEQLDSSQTYLDKALQLQKNATYKVAEIQAIQATLFQNAGQWEAAKAALQKALHLTQREDGKKGLATARCWLALGKHYQQQKQWATARQAFSEALWALSWQTKRRLLPPMTSLFSKRMALQIGNAQGQTLLQLQEASKYAVSREVLEQQLTYNLALLNSLQLQQPWDALLWQEAQKTHQQSVEWNWRRFGQTANSSWLEAAFVQAEANRQFVIGKQLQRSWQQHPNRALVLLQEQLQEQQIEEQWFQQQLWKIYKQGDSTQLNWHRQQLAASKANWTLLHQQFKEQYQQYYNWHYTPQNIDLDNIQAHLQKGDVLLQYLEAKNTVYQFVITKDTLILRRVFWEEYQPTVQKYGKHFTSPKMLQYLGSGSFQDFCRTGHSLYYRLVHHDLFKQAKRLIIIPDGLLQQLPFETLLTEIPLEGVHQADFSKLDYLLQQKSILYHYSSQLWAESWQHKAAINHELLALGTNYEEKTLGAKSLRGQIPQQYCTEALLDSLAQNYAGDFYHNRYASEVYYKEATSNYGLFYLGFYAYNGRLNNALPSLILAEDDGEDEDNFLSFYEIQEQAMQADLVFLGNVHKAQPNDLLALGTSFLYAGSKNVVLPLWQQDSTVVDLVRQYYQGLQQGLENDEALRQAKLQYLRTAEGIAGHPSHWAGYILIGNQQTIKVAAPIIYIWWFVFPIAFMGFLGWWSLQGLRQRR